MPATLRQNFALEDPALDADRTGRGARDRRAVLDVSAQDLMPPEAEQELVAGFFTEYSGMKFAMFFMGEYINMITMSALVTLLFLGGWHSYIGLDIPILVFAAKVFLLLCVFIWLRSTFPRIRYDRLMTFGWKILLPIAMLNMFFYSVVKVLWPA